MKALLKDLMLCMIAIFIGNAVFAGVGLWCMSEGASPTFIYKLTMMSVILVSFIMARILIKEYRKAKTQQ